MAHKTLSLRLFKTIIVILLISLTGTAHAKSTCDQFFSKKSGSKISLPTYSTDISLKLSFSQIYLLDFLAKKSIKDPLDLTPENMENGLVELRKLILSTPKGEVDNIFDSLSKKEFKLLEHRYKRGLLKLKAQQELMLVSLFSFVKKDTHNVLIENKTGTPWNSLLTRYPEFRGPGHKNDVGGVIAGVGTYTLTKIEPEIIDAGYGRHSRFGRGKWWQRLWVHPYFKVKRILKFNNQVRIRLEYLDQLKRSILDEINQEARFYEFSAEELTQIRMALKSIDDARKNIILDLEKAYGQQIHVGGIIIVPKDIDIYVISKKIRLGGLIQKDYGADYALKAERALEHVEEAFNTARERHEMAGRTEADMDSRALRIRHRQYNRLSRQAQGQWRDIMHEHTDLSVSVRYHWYENKTVWYRGADGKMKSKQERVRRTGRSDVTLSYFNILYNRLSSFSSGNSKSINGRTVTINSVSGKGAILEESKKMAKLEQEIYGLAHYIGVMERGIENHKQILMESNSNHEVFLRSQTDVKDSLDTLYAKIKLVETHVVKGPQEISHLWRYDKEDHFKRRNKQLFLGLNKLREHFETYQEQLNRKEADLVIKADVLDHTKEMNRLALWMGTQYFTEGVIGTGAVTGGIMYFVDPQFQSYVNNFLQTLF